MKRIFTLLLALVMALSVTTAYAATIDNTKTASLNIYKYDMTKVAADGDWDPDSYVSNGQKDDAVINALKSYAVQGVEFTYRATRS